MSKNLLLTLLTMVVVWKCAPTSSVSSGGGASETVATVVPHQNGIKVSVVADDAFIVTVFIYQEAFSPKDTEYYRDTALLSDRVNEWLIPELSESIYHVFVIDSVKGEAVFFRCDNSRSDSMRHQSKNLAAFGTLSGTVSLIFRSGGTEPAVGYNVYIQGSPFVSVTDDHGGYMLSGIPEGEYAVGAYLAVYRQPNSVTKAIIEITSDSLSIQNIILDETS